MDHTPDSPTLYPPPRRPGSLIPTLFGLLALAAIGGFGYWKFVYYPTTPQFALERFFTAAKARDFDTVYNLVHVTGLLKATVPNAGMLRELAQRMPGLVPEVEEYRLGKSNVNGNRASVETNTTTRTQKGTATNSLNVELERVNGAWMIDGQWVLREAGKRGLSGLVIKGSEGL